MQEGTECRGAEKEARKRGTQYGVSDPMSRLLLGSSPARAQIHRRPLGEGIEASFKLPFHEGEGLGYLYTSFHPSLVRLLGEEEVNIRGPHLLFQSEKALTQCLRKKLKTNSS